MSASELEAKKRELKEVFSEILGRALDLEILERALSSFLNGNNELYDFDFRFDPPLTLDAEGVVKALSVNDFDGFGITRFGDQVFLTLYRLTPVKKRLVVVYRTVDANGKTLYNIERVTGTTFT